MPEPDYLGSGTGVWDIGSLASGTSTTMTLTDHRLVVSPNFCNFPPPIGVGQVGGSTPEEGKA
jgi:hypothetical protein